MLTTQFGEISLRLMAEYSTSSPKPSPNCAPKRLQIVLFAPLYSVDNIAAPRLMTALLTEGL